MPQNREYPAKTRPAAAMDRSLFPTKKRGAGVGEGQPSGPSPRKGDDGGNPPKKGVLTTGGGHG